MSPVRHADRPTTTPPPTTPPPEPWASYATAPDEGGVALDVVRYVAPRAVAGARGR